MNCAGRLIKSILFATVMLVPSSMTNSRSKNQKMKIKKFTMTRLFGFQVLIIYSRKEILPGQQLLENPVDFTVGYDRIANPDIGSHLYHADSKPYIDSFADARRIKEQRGIAYFCPLNCYCRDSEIDNLVKESKSIFQLVESKKVGFIQLLRPKSSPYTKYFTFHN